MSKIRSLNLTVLLMLALTAGTASIVYGAEMSLNSVLFKPGDNIRVEYKLDELPEAGQLYLLVIPADDAYSSSIPDGYVGSMKPVRLPMLKSGGASVKIPVHHPKGDYVVRIVMQDEISFASRPVLQSPVLTIDSIVETDELTVGQEYRQSKQKDN